MNVRAIQTNDDFWPAFLRATLLKLDTFAIFVSISVVVYMFVAWLSGPTQVDRKENLSEVKTEYRVRMAAREPQSVSAAVVRPEPTRPVAERIRANERQVLAAPVARPTAVSPRAVDKMPVRQVVAKSRLEQTKARPAATLSRPKPIVKKAAVKTTPKTAVKSKAKTPGRAMADAKRVSEKSRRN